MQPSVHGGARLAAMALVATALMTSTSGCASPGVTKAELFVTRDQRIVVHGASLHRGEAILHVENDDGAPHVVVLARLAPDVSALPVVDGTVPVGRPSAQSYSGAGYHVVAKSERMAAYFNGPNRVRAEFHVYLRPGRYLVFANARGDYSRGLYTMLTVPA